MEGPSIKIHAAVDGRGLPVRIVPLAGQASDKTLCPALLHGLPAAKALVERFFCKLKHFRRIATRFDKLARNFRAAVIAPQPACGPALMKSMT